MDATEIQKEHERLALLKELRLLLEDALKSLGGKPSHEMESRYLFWIATRVNLVAEGYLFIREPRVEVSKILVRPIVELTFYALALMKKRGFLFRQAYTELKSEKIFFPDRVAAEQWFGQQVEDLERAIQRAEPDYPIERLGIRFKDITELEELAKAKPIYKDYRVYCQFTHGALRAIRGVFDEVTYSRDTNLVIWGVAIQLDLLKEHTPADVPDLMPFLERWRSLAAPA